MTKQILIAVLLLLILTTFTTKEKISLEKFNIKEIKVENNTLLKDEEIRKLLIPIYEKNLIFLSNNEVKKLVIQNSLIESFIIKKKYPNKLKIKIFEKKPIAILLNKQKKFYLSEKIDLIEFKNYPNFKNLPYVIGDQENFKKFYNNLNEVNFPHDLIKKYVFFETNRWDLETYNNKIIKLPSKNYKKSLKNFMSLKNQDNFKKYRIFDYRIKNQLILQ